MTSAWLKCVTLKLDLREATIGITFVGQGHKRVDSEPLILSILIPNLVWLIKHSIARVFALFDKPDLKRAKSNSY